MFITFEGVDFCGKSTQVELLKNYLEEKNQQVEIIREPGGTEISELIRTILLDKKNNKMVMETEIFLFSAARAQLVREKIIPYLKAGKYVISDRFHDSTTAYQGSGRGITKSYVEAVNSLAIGETIPDITFFIDIPVETADSRKKQKDSVELDRIEVSDNSFFNKVRDGYLEIATKEKRFKIINGCGSIDEIHKTIINELERFEKDRKS